MADEPLRNAATRIDRLLSGARYQTVVHGDAKLANFCFSPDRQRVAAVDFQYAGGGCGMKDLAYLVGSCLDAGQCETLESRVLDLYFKTLHEGLRKHHPTVDREAVEAEWRALYAPAWADFQRFLKGWSPDHWKLNAYGERLTRQTLASLTQDR